MEKTFTLDKTKTALIIIDLQKGITGREAKPYSSKQVIENAVQLLDAFHKNEMLVFLVHVGSAPDQKDRLNPVADISWSGSGAPLPADWSQLVPELLSRNSDFIITKKQWGAFYGTEIDLELRRRKIETIVLCGISTNIGVESTARFAYEYGYNQIFVEDAMSAQSAEEHEHTVEKIFPRIGLVRKTEEVLLAINS